MYSYAKRCQDAVAKTLSGRSALLRIESLLAGNSVDGLVGYDSMKQSSTNTPPEVGPQERKQEPAFEERHTPRNVLRMQSHQVRGDKMGQSSTPVIAAPSNSEHASGRGGRGGNHTAFSEKLHSEGPEPLSYERTRSSMSQGAPVSPQQPRRGEGLRTSRSQPVTPNRSALPPGGEREGGGSSPGGRSVGGSVGTRGGGSVSGDRLAGSAVPGPYSQASLVVCPSCVLLPYPHMLPLFSAWHLAPSFCLFVSLSLRQMPPPTSSFCRLHLPMLGSADYRTPI